MEAVVDVVDAVVVVEEAADKAPGYFRPSPSFSPLLPFNPFLFA